MKTKEQILGKKQNLLYRNTIGLLILISLFLLVAISHIMQQPYPNNWDDAWYAINTYNWLDFIKERDLFRGIFWGYIYMLQGKMPPMVFITSIVGGLINKTIIAMHFSQLIWFFALMLAVFGIGNELADGWAGFLSIIIVATMDLVFYWVKTIMGEPSLFALVAIFLFLLIRWGDKPTLWHGGVIGFVIGVGLLTKQHFPILIISPLVLWLLWLANRCVHNNTLFKLTIFSITAAFVTAVITAASWYTFNLNTVFSYFLETQQGFAPHSLGNTVSWNTIYRFFETLFGQIGWPACLLIGIGYFWTCYQIFYSGSKRLANEWKAMGHLLLLSSSSILLLFVLYDRIINTRFLAPALILWGILAGLALRDFWMHSRSIVRAFIILILTFQVIFWWNQSFSPVLQNLPTLFPQKSFMRPIDIKPLPEALNVLATYIQPSKKDTIWVVGETSRFNPPMVFALITERAYKWQAQRVYSWQDPDNLKPILDRLVKGDWIIIYKSIGNRPDLFTNFDFDTLLIRFDKDILLWVKTHPNNYNLISKLEFPPANNRIWIFKIQK